MTTTAGPADRRSVAFPGGAALLGSDGAWVLAHDDPARSLGPALAVARQTGGPVNLVVEEAAGLLTRRALQFAQPPAVWFVAGQVLEQVDPEPLPDIPALDPRVAAFAGLLIEAGADPVVEHGRLIGEVLGLEVARVEVDETGPRLEIGVGRFDREAHALLSADDPTVERLRAVVELVRRQRDPAGEPHPIQRLAHARALRARIIAEPALVGADHLTPMAPVVEAPDLRTPWPVPATGLDRDGQPIVVVCSVGIDLDLVPAAADARLADGRGARLVLAMPERDAHPITRWLAGALRQPADIVTID